VVIHTSNRFQTCSDDRPAGDTAAPALWFAYSPDRKGEHPERHLREFRGTLQADAYAGFNQLYANGRIQESGVLGPRSA
jgi:transposase